MLHRSPPSFRSLQAAAAAFFAAAIVAVGSGAEAFGQQITRASVGPAGLETDSGSWRSAVSDDGNVIAFESTAKNLVPGDKAATFDVFVRDVAADTLECLSLSIVTGKPGGGASFDPHISGDGRYVAFVSDAPELVPGDNNGNYDVFWFDRLAHALVRVSVDSNGAETLYGSTDVRLSKDGQLVLFTSDTPDFDPSDLNFYDDVFVHDVRTAVTERVSVGWNGNDASDHCYGGGISDDGRYVVFTSAANNLVSNDGNPQADVFLVDRQSAAIALVSIDSNGNSANEHCRYASISGDGHVVAFVSSADNLVPGDTNRNDDVFSRDLTTFTTAMESVDSNGKEDTGSCLFPLLSTDGRIIAFSTYGRLEPGLGNPGKQRVYARDRALGFTHCLAKDASGLPSTGQSGQLALSADGRFCSFWGDHDDLVAGDTNHRADVFVHETDLTPASATTFGNGLAGSSGVPAISATLPQINTGCTLTVLDSAGIDTVGVVFLGDASGSVPTNLGADIELLPQFVFALTIPMNGLLLTAAIPADEFLIGAPLAVQVLELDAGAIHGVSFTPRLDLTFGR